MAYVAKVLPVPPETVRSSGLDFLNKCILRRLVPVSSLPVVAVCVVVHTAAAHPAVPSVISRSSLIACRSLHFLEHSAIRRAVYTVCLFLPATVSLDIS